jgi:hypothetical protein
LGLLYPVTGLSGNCVTVVVCSIVEDERIIIYIVSFCIVWFELTTREHSVNVSLCGISGTSTEDLKSRVE